MKNSLFWDVTPSGSCKNRRFERTYRLYHQCERNERTRNNISSNWQLPELESMSGDVGFVVNKEVLEQVFSEYFGFPFRSFHRLVHTHHNQFSAAATIVKQWPTHQEHSVSAHLISTKWRRNCSKRGCTIAQAVRRHLHTAGPGFMPRPNDEVLWCTKQHWVRFLRVLKFPLLIFIHHPSFFAGVMGQILWD
jgi:hypothetical protein